MPKDDFNSPYLPGTGANAAKSPHALMFDRLVSDMQSTLEEEIWFDDADWPDGFDWHSETDAVWEGLAEDAHMIARFPPNVAGDRLLARSAGLVLRAIRAETLADLEQILIRFSVFKREDFAEHVHFLLQEAIACIEEMAVRAQNNDPDGPNFDPFSAG